MNITELARKLQITTQELKDVLPTLGFDIGQRAIKVDDRQAHKIIESWPALKKEMEKRKAAELAKLTPEEEAGAATVEKVKVKLPQVITVRDFAARLNLPVTGVIKELMKNGILASLNERIDYETAAIVAEDMGFEVEKVDEEKIEGDFVGDKVKELMGKDEKSTLKARPPVVVVMGHVDHGKTKLLDAIRKTHVMESEAGGITQHIGAYQATYKDRVLTFIDTPGHEAFTAMRSRGAKIADIAILVVAADDGVQPQTKEAIKIIEAAKIPFLVAINKIDKPEANIEKIKQELAALNLIPEDWGGKTICVPISAKQMTGIDDILNMVLLIADMEKEKIVANPDRCAMGTVIEAHIDKGEGPVATVLVQAGTLNRNDNLTIDNVLYGRVRAMKNFRGEPVDLASPGTPVKILGLKAAPQVGDILEVKDDLGACQRKIKPTYARRDQVVVKKSSEEEESKKKKLKIILKTDVLGSLEALLASFEKFDYPTVSLEIVTRGLGNITEAEVLQAEAVGAKIFGFNVLTGPNIDDLARDKGVQIKICKIIYDLIDEIKKDLEDLLEMEIVRTELGKIEVLAIFRTEAANMIVGGKVKEGKIVFNPKTVGQTKIKVLRKGEEVGEGVLNGLQSAKSEVKEVAGGQECGVKYKGKPIVQVGDTLEIYREEKRARKLE
ncbi:translation initiation factor IF-2 [Patescibacteria group bacterium]|nr:translation initiation factor IF-2 [Patescibacteria group bacterium]